MSQTTIESVIAAAAHRRRAGRDEAFFEMVRRLADGEQIDPDEVLDICEFVDRDASEVPAEVDRVLRRRQLKADLDAGNEADVNAALEDIAAKMQQADAIFEAARKAHAAAVQPLLAQRDEWTARRRAAKNAARELLTTAPKTLADERAAILHDIEQTSAKMEDLRAEIVRVRGIHDENQRHAEEPTVNLTVERLSIELRAIEAEHQRHRNALKEHEAKMMQA